MFDIKKEIALLKDKNEYRELKTLESFQDVKVKYDERVLHLLGSNNYLSLNNNPELNQISKDAIDEYGTGSGGSRLTTGTTTWHTDLELKISEFKGTEDTLVFCSGYTANLGAISGLADKSWTVFSDKYNHASIVDGIMLSGAKLVRYKHCDVVDLRKRLVQSDSEKKLIITDSVFSMDGNIAPITEIIELAEEFKALLLVDDAHGFGVLGRQGKGISEYLGVTKGIDLTIGTLSKAVPSSGGYVTGKRDLIDLIRNRARSFIFSTSPTPSVMAVSHKAIDIIKTSDYRRLSLIEKTNYFINVLNDNGFDIMHHTTPIVPIIIGDSETTLKIQESLLEAGILIPAIRPPTVPRGSSRLRASINYNHSFEDLKHIAEKISEIARAFGVV